MRILIQRVNSASVVAENETVGHIAGGLLLLVGFGTGDDSPKLKPMAEKISNMRLFAQGDKKFHLSLLETEGKVLLVPQFTLYADTSKGRRPDFFGSLEPQLAEALFNLFVAEVEKILPGRTQTGKFGAYMQVKLENDGPATFWLES